MTTITIIVDDAGQLTVNGPIGDKVLSLGILEVAKDSILEYHRKHAQRVQLAEPGLTPITLRS